MNPEPWYVHHLWNFIEASIPIGLFWLASRKESQRKHDENQDLLKQVVHEHNERPAHTHPEEDGPLYAQNIQYAPPKRFNGR